MLHLNYRHAIISFEEILTIQTKPDIATEKRLGDAKSDPYVVSESQIKIKEILSAAKSGKKATIVLSRDINPDDILNGLFKTDSYFQKLFTLLPPVLPPTRNSDRDAEQKYLIELMVRAEFGVTNPWGKILLEEEEENYYHSHKYQLANDSKILYQELMAADTFADHGETIIFFTINLSETELKKISLQALK